MTKKLALAICLIGILFVLMAAIPLHVAHHVTYLESVAMGLSVMTVMLIFVGIAVKLIYWATQ